MLSAIISRAFNSSRQNFVLPTHSCPSPRYPSLQEQMNEPWVLIQSALG